MQPQDGRAWPNYASDYASLVRTAAAAQARVVAANAPRRYVSLVGRKGVSALAALPAPDAACLPAPGALTPVSDALRNKISRELGAAQAPAPVEQPANEDQQQSSLPQVQADANGGATSQPPTAGAEGRKCPYVGMRVSDNFLAAQGLWDACMTDSILAALGHSCNDDGGGCSGHASPAQGVRQPLVLHVCGKFHMEERLGICERLAERAPGVSAGTIVAVPVDVTVVREALAHRPLREFGDSEIVPGMQCTVGEMRGLGDFVVLTDSQVPRSF